MIHHVLVAPLHTAGTVGLLDQVLLITARQQFHIPLTVDGRPPVCLGGAGNGGLQGHIRVQLPQSQHRLGKIEVTALGHAADEMAKAPAVQVFQGIRQGPFQIQTAFIALPAAPGQTVGPVAGETTANLPRVHSLTPFNRTDCIIKNPPCQNKTMVLY